MEKVLDRVGCTVIRAAMHTNVISTSRGPSLLPPSFLPPFLLCLPACFPPSIPSFLLPPSFLPSSMAHEIRLCSPASPLLTSDVPCRMRFHRHAPSANLCASTPARVSNPVTMRPNIGYRIMHFLFSRRRRRRRHRHRETHARRPPSSSPSLARTPGSNRDRRYRGIETGEFSSVDSSQQATRHTESATYPRNENEFLDKGYAARQEGANIAFSNGQTFSAPAPPPSYNGTRRLAVKDLEFAFVDIGWGLHPPAIMTFLFSRRRDPSIRTSARDRALECRGSLRAPI